MCRLSNQILPFTRYILLISTNETIFFLCILDTFRYLRRMKKPSKFLFIKKTALFLSIFTTVNRFFSPFFEIAISVK